MPLPRLLPRVLSPRVAHVIGGIGRVLFGAGLLVLLFAVYQLWGTGLQHSQAQDRLDGEFAEQLETLRSNETTTTSTSDTTAPTTDTTAPTTPTDAPEPDPEVLAALVPDNGDPVARLQIPSIGVDEIVVHGVNVSDLRLGPGHFPDSPLPGQPGNAAIAGHRTTYGQPFHDLDKIAPGDEIVVETVQGRFTYEVMGHPADAAGPDQVGHFIVPDTGVEVLDDAGDDRLTLTACHPKFSSRQRIIVTALLVEEPAPAPPPRPVVEDPDDEQEAEPDVTPDAAADFGEALDGDDDALVPTALWGAAFFVALAVVAIVGRLWRRWPAYLLGAPVLLVLLFVTFEHLDRYLPAY